MAFPVVVDRAKLVGDIAATQHVVPLPANVPAGALLCIFGRIGQAGTITITETMGGTWTLVQDESDASPDVTFVAYRQTLATGTEGGGSITFAHASAKMAAVSFAVTGCESPAVKPPVASTVVVGTTAAPRPALLAPPEGALDYLWVTFAAYAGEQSLTPTVPTNYSEDYGSDTGVAGAVATNCRVHTAVRAFNAASQRSAAWGISVAAAGWTSYMVAFYPYSGPPPAATGASSGKPGSFTPTPNTPPANLAAAIAKPIVASPSTPWYDGEYVVLGDSSEASWNGSTWVVGRGTGGPAPVPVGAIQAAWFSPGAGAVTSVAVTLPNPVTAGNLIVVGYTRDHTAVGTDTCADNRGTAYGSPVQTVDNTNNAQEYNLWSGIAPVTGSYTITVSLPSSSYVTIVAAEYGAITSRVPNVSGQAMGKAGTSAVDGWVGPSITTTVDGCLVVGLMGVTFGEANLAPGTGWLEDVDTASPGTPTLQLEARVQAAKGAIAPTWTAPANSFDAIAAAFPRTVAPTGIAVKRWSGSAWVAAVVKRWSGSAWVTTTPKRRDAGGTWK